MILLHIYPQYLAQIWKHCNILFSALIDCSSCPSASGTEINAAPWTTEEQKLLEQALKTYPVSTPERWEKIAAAVPGRSKKDCMKRYKVIIAIVTLFWIEIYPTFKNASHLRVFGPAQSFSVPLVQIQGRAQDVKNTEFQKQT